MQGEQGAQVLVNPTMTEYLCESLTSVRTVKVKIRKILAEELAVRPAKNKDVRAPKIFVVAAEIRKNEIFFGQDGKQRVHVHLM